MTILEKYERIALQKLFDQDKTEVFQLFMKKLREGILKKPAVGSDQWTHNLMTITKQAQYDCIDLILEQLNEELAAMEVDKDE